MKIRHRITAVLLLFLFLALITQGTFIWSTQQEFESTVQQGAEEIGQQTLHGILNTLEREAVFHRASALEFAESPVLAASNQRFETSSNPEALLAVYQTEWQQGNATLLARVQENPLSTALQDRMTGIERARGYSSINEAFITNRYGGLVAAYGTPTDYDQRDERWWQTARNGSIFINDVGYDRSTRSMSITLAIPSSEEGTVQGVMKVIIDTQDPGRLLREAIGESRIIQRGYIVNETDHVLWAENRSRIGTVLRPGGNPLPSSGTFRAPSLVSGGMTNWHVTVDRSHRYQVGDDFRMVLSFAPSVTAGTEERMEQNALATVGLFLFLGLLMLFGMRFYLHRPLERLRDTLDDVSQGDMTAEIEADLTERDDEIGELARSFDRLMVSMRLASQQSGVHTDVELRALEEELSMKEAALERAPIGIVITDPHQEDNPIIWSSEGFEQMTGYDREEIEGKNCRFLQGPRTDEAKVHAIREALDAEEPVTVTIKNYRKDGEPFWNLLHIRPVRDDDGALKYFVGFQIDISSLEDVRMAEQAGEEPDG